MRVGDVGGQCGWACGWMGGCEDGRERGDGIGFAGVWVCCFFASQANVLINKRVLQRSTHYVWRRSNPHPCSFDT